MTSQPSFKSLRNKLTCILLRKIATDRPRGQGSGTVGIRPVRTALPCCKANPLFLCIHASDYLAVARGKPRLTFVLTYRVLRFGMRRPKSTAPGFQPKVLRSAPLPAPRLLRSAFPSSNLRFLANICLRKRANGGDPKSRLPGFMKQQVCIDLMPTNGKMASCPPRR